MRFVHVADLHLGKMLNQVSLIDLQKEALDKIVLTMKERHITNLIIAGDVYDRSIPSLEAINLFNSFISELILENHFEVYLISGNHDSSDRLHFASGLLEKQGLHIESYLHLPLTTYPFEDEYGKVYLHMCPFTKPSYISKLLNTSSFDSYNEAFKCFFEKEISQYKEDERHVLVAHQFVAGNQQVQLSDSEVPTSVGGSEIVEYHLFENYDYVALGHLHASQKIKHDRIRYSGSLLKYAFSEAKQEKSFTIVELKEKGNVSIETIPYSVSKDVCVYRGYFKDFMEKDDILHKEDYISFELLDEMMIPMAMEQLRSKYPNALQLSYVSYMNSSYSQKEMTRLEEKDPYQLFNDFFEFMLDRKLDEKQEKIVLELMEKAGEHCVD